jgi:hypothetical protein
MQAADTPSKKKQAAVLAFGFIEKRYRGFLLCQGLPHFLQVGG